MAIPGDSVVVYGPELVGLLVACKHFNARDNGWTKVVLRP
ncbi:MAG: hypothetical protein JWR26_4399 [Pedosphaera sp.]|nr:hypothetical protein [Pedosphaera sp.]